MPTMKSHQEALEAAQAAYPNFAAMSADQRIAAVKEVSAEVAPLSWFSTVTKNGTACLESNPGVHYTYQILFTQTGVCDVYYGRVDRNLGSVTWTLMGTRAKVEKAIVFANSHNAEPTF